MSNNTLRLTAVSLSEEKIHHQCGGVLRQELQPQTLHFRGVVHHPQWVDTNEVMSRCDKCGLVGIPIEPANA